MEQQMSSNNGSIFSTRVVHAYRNTSAINIYNDKDFSYAFNKRIEGLHTCLTAITIPAEAIPVTYYVEEFRQPKLNNAEALNYAEAFILLQQDVFGIVVDDKISKTEKEKFIFEYCLDTSINTAHALINEVFGNVDVKTELYIDPEETQYKFLNISIRPKSLSSEDINSILDKFDDLQEKFITRVEKKYASKITFHLDID
ncbi:MAG: hypothetical protein A2Z59_09945 [Nitrospinae bacterium RIFCSPLOWO2_02_39_17]|nr:MAG: hypothetical protein A2Z59_09945 [Nitrospinae bacterium RIFCSPLOWO2_02_39_17]